MFFSPLYACTPAAGALFSTFLGFGCQRLSVELDPHRGVVNRRFLSLYWSFRPAVLYRASQEAVLRSSSGLVVANILSFALEGSKVRGMSGQKYVFLAKIRPSEVVFSKFSRLSKSIDVLF